MKKIIGDKIKKYIPWHCILLTLISGIILIPNVYADNDLQLDKEVIINQYACITVSGKDLNDVVHLEIINPYNYEKHLAFNIQIPWVYSRGDTRIYGWLGNNWTTIPKDLEFLPYEADFQAGGRHTLIIEHTYNDVVTKKDGNYEFSYFIAGSFDSNLIEIRIPVKKGWDRLKILNYSVAPYFEGERQGYYIARWDKPSYIVGENATYNNLGVQYIYQFPWEQYLDKVKWIFVGIFLTLSVGYTSKFIKWIKKRLGKPKKKAKN